MRATLTRSALTQTVINLLANKIEWSSGFAGNDQRLIAVSKITLVDAPIDIHASFQALVQSQNIAQSSPRQYSHTSAGA